MLLHKSVGVERDVVVGDLAEGSLLDDFLDGGSVWEPRSKIRGQENIGRGVMDLSMVLVRSSARVVRSWLTRMR